MKGVSRLLPFMLLFLLIAGSLGGCGGGSTAETTVAETTAAGEQTVRNLRLPYFKSDPLHPFKAASLVNIQLASLLYDGLFTLDASCNPEPVIASGYVKDTLSVTVAIKNGLSFSDGTPLTAEDVVYSFNQAQAAPAYAARLANFASAKKTGSSGVVFNLKTPNPYAVNCLTYPVIKNNDTTDTPIGSGRYTVDESEVKPILTANPSRLGGFLPNIQKISLTETADSQTLNYSLQIGNIDFTFSDLSGGSYRRINATTVDVGLNNLVFLGLNSNASNLQDAAVRKAISLLIDKNGIAGTAFQGHARAAFTPFNPDFTGSADYAFERNLNGASELLNLAGFNKFNNTGIRYNSSNSTLTFSLLVNADNPYKTAAAELIAQQLSETGIKINISSLAFDAYMSAIQAGTFDLYIGEVLLTPDMNLNPLLAPGGSAAYGINTSTGAASVAYSLFVNGSTDIKGFVDVFTADMPFVPLCYRNGIAMYARELKVPTACKAGDVFCDIQAWSF